MSSFNIEIRKITVTEHPNADALEIGNVDGYQFVVRKGEFQSGDAGAYIPEKAILPTTIIEAMGLAGRLAGPEGNRVKAIRLRGVLSQGLFYVPQPWPTHWQAGLDVTEELGITKYVPPIPLEMSGQVTAVGAEDFRSYTDVEDIKKFNQVLVTGEEVIFTEKLHGTCSIFYLNAAGERYVSSKGLASKGLAIKEAEGNIYWRMARKYQIFEKLGGWLEVSRTHNATLFGETLGVQDLMYGLKKGDLAFRAFDLWVSAQSEPYFMQYNQFTAWCVTNALPNVPVLYQGPLSAEALATYSAGISTIASHIREGIVIRPLHERYHSDVGRVLLKSLSPDYLVRKGGTEME